MRSIDILGFGAMGLQLAALFSVLGYSVNLWNRTITDERRKKLRVQTRILQRAQSRNGQGVILGRKNRTSILDMFDERQAK